MTQLILIRHGETLWNEQRRMQGHSDSPLTETGLCQVRLLARRLAQVEFAALYSSDSWDKKPFPQWSEKDVERILNNSPWAKSVSAAMGMWRK